MAGGVTLRPVVLERGRRRHLLGVTLLSSSCVFFAALLILDPAAPAPAAALRPLDHTVVGDPPPDVPHDMDRAKLDKIVESALSWLARHQYEDGSWSASAYTQMCPDRVCLGAGREENSLTVTALAVLAFVESGVLDRRDFRAAAERGLKWLIRQMDASDCCGRREGKYMLGHAIATLALARAHVSVDPVHKYWARRALEFLLNARNPGAGWRYGFRGGESDLFVTGWAMAAVEAARDVGLTADPSIDYEAARWVDELTDPRDYRAGYRRKGERGWSIPGVNDQYDEHETNTAIALHVRMAAGQSRTYPAAVGATWRLAHDLPYVNRGGASVDYLYWYHGTQALARHQAPGGQVWSQWYPRAMRGLVGAQRTFRDGCYEGSWEPSDRWGCEGGRVYATAINAVTLATIARTLPPPAALEVAHD